jgi:hypothetical protein
MHVVTITAIALYIQDQATGRPIGLAVVCAAARYASVLWSGGDRLERLHATPAEWREIEHQINNGLDPRPLMSTSPLAVFFNKAASSLRQVRWLHSTPLKVRDPLDTGPTLDALLWRVSIETDHAPA